MKSRIVEFAKKERGFGTLFVIDIACMIFAFFLPTTVLDNNLPIWLKVFTFLLLFYFRYLL